MHTTLTLDDALAQRAREVAERENTTLARLLEEGLRLRLSTTPLPVFHGGTGLAPGIDPLSNRSLFAAADEAERAKP